MTPAVLDVTPSVLSLTVGVNTPLAASIPASWSSTNAAVSVNNGMLYAAADALRPDGQAVVTAVSGVQEDTCEVTIVPWTANVQQLERVALLPNFNVSKNGLTLYANLGASLYQSTDDMINLSALPALPVGTTTRLLFTDQGVFLRSIDSIYRSTNNMLTWVLSTSSLLSYLYHSFDYYDDGATTYIYTSEYDGDSSHRHRIVRGTISGASETWETAIEFYSPNEYDADPITYALAARHLHFVIVDQATGDVYASTGDSDTFSRLLVSQDNGGTWKILGVGDQKWRSLSMWFTADYIYWNMDAVVTQKIWRLARTDLAAQAVGNDLSEAVVTLDNGSMWYHCWGKDSENRDMVIMGQSAEGQLRDWRGRVFTLRELVGGSVVAQEVYTLLSNTPAEYSAYTQLEPMCQMGNYIYFRARDAEISGCLKMQWAGS